jgi:predicted RNA-binding Zn-ribbon protein involved in translation (DUF1610 family)
MKWIKTVSSTNGTLKRGTMKTHQPCPACGSSDGRTYYDDGQEHYFVCKTEMRDIEEYYRHSFSDREDEDENFNFKF